MYVCMYVWVKGLRDEEQHRKRERFLIQKKQGVSSKSNDYVPFPFYKDVSIQTERWGETEREGERD